MSDSQASEEDSSLRAQPRRRRYRSRILLCVAAFTAAALLAILTAGTVVMLNNGRSKSDDDRIVGAAVAALGSPLQYESGEASNDQFGASNDLIGVSLKQPTYFPTTYEPTAGEPPRTTIDAADAADAPLTFYAVGDVPYSDMEACLLPHELKKLSPADGKFLVHLGDIQDGRSKGCPESLYRDVAAIFESSPVPAFFVVGDNEWQDCGVGAPAKKGMRHWSKHLLKFYERADLDWPTLDADVTHHPDHPEMYSFALDGVLFLGQGVPWPQDENLPSSEEWEGYLRTNADWTRDNLASHVEGEGIRAAVIMAHSSSSQYFNEVKSIASSHSHVPILFLEDHHWFLAEKYRDAPNLFRVALDDTVTPASITVDTNAVGDDVFRYDRGCWCTDAHRPTRLELPPPEERCEGACDTNRLCKAENACGRDGATC